MAKARIEPEDAVTGLMALSSSFKDETDRGVALAGGSFIELATAKLLKAFLAENKSGQAIVERTAGQRLELCHALGLITDNEYSICSQIARIRNSFAHQFAAMSFEDDNVRPLCMELPESIIQGLERPKSPELSESRWRFERAVYRTAAHMHFERPDFFERYRLRTMVVENFAEGNELMRSFTYYSPGHFEDKD